MPRGKTKQGLTLADIPKLPLTASLNEMHKVTGISYNALKKLADDEKITAIPTEGSKIMLSTWSVIERFNLAPIGVLKEIWLQKGGVINEL
jgi:hypothetical protein